MRRFYVTGHDVWAGHSDLADGRRVRHIDLFHPAVGSHGIHLIQYTDPAHCALLHSDDPNAKSLLKDGQGPDEWEALPEVQAWRASGSLMLLSTDFRSDDEEAIWHAHPEVARLQHPTLEGNIPLDQLHQKPDFVGKQFKKRHLDGLGTIGIKGSHTVLDVHKIARAINPLCRLGSLY